VAHGDYLFPKAQCINFSKEKSKMPVQGNTGSSQSAQILTYLQSGHTLTELDGLQLFRCMSVAQRIHDLRRKGHRIISTMVTVPSGKRVAEYRLEQANNEIPV
jgi:Helix-turn-helix domain